MRILIHDFAGHPFQVQLSRALAGRGHAVTHVYPVGLAGPKGRLERSASDPAELSIQGISLSRTFKKYSPHRRFAAHRTYAGDLKRLIAASRADAVLSGNTPIDIQAELLWHCRRNQINFVHWVQDVYCEAIRYFLKKRLPFGHVQLSHPFRLLERNVAYRSNHTVVISPGFKTLLGEWGVPPNRMTVVENWAPLDEVPLRPRQNAWRERLGLNDNPTFLYSGTLGLKHRPDLLYLLAKAIGPRCNVVVLSEGVGRDWLDAQPRLPNLFTLGFQPYECVPDVLASADVLLATLEIDAGQFAVPSKILTYLCSGRPILLAGPKENLAADVIERSQAGIVVDPRHESAWIDAAEKLVTGQAYRESLGRNARKYAETEFDISRIARKFEAIFSGSPDAAGVPAFDGVTP
jgi:glycosyltransferase involved in cell wall biosynthesis